MDRALDSFIQDGHILTDGIDAIGFRQQMRDSIAASILFKNTPNSFVWVAEDAGEVAAFALTQTRPDVDGSLCYWMTHAWVS